MRFSIWKSSVEIFKTSPIYGTSPRNLLSYAHDKLPNTFISQKSIVCIILFEYLDKRWSTWVYSFYDIFDI